MREKRLVLFVLRRWIWRISNWSLANVVMRFDNLLSFVNLLNWSLNISSNNVSCIYWHMWNNIIRTHFWILQNKGSSELSKTTIITPWKFTNFSRITICLLIQICNRIEVSLFSVIHQIYSAEHSVCSLVYLFYHDGFMARPPN